LATAAADSVSDARLMLLCFEKWGTPIIDNFVGDFALALWDRPAERLVLARDFVGQRPLHFHDTKGTLAVASMASGLHALSYVPRGADEARMVEMLVGVPHEGRRTFLAGVERVEPGEVLSFGRGPLVSRIFWTPPVDKIRLKSHEEYAEALLEKLDDAVGAQLRGASGTVGAHLSAGLDSSAVATSAATLFSGRVLAFTSVPPDRLPTLPRGRFGNEGPLAARTASLHPSIEHRLIPTGDRIPLEMLKCEQRLFERPDLNLPNLAWANRINAAAAADGVRVLLVGTMGNSTISHTGYELLGELLGAGRISDFWAEYAAARNQGMRARLLLGQAVRQALPGSLIRASARIRHRAKHPSVAGVVNRDAPGLKEILTRFECNDDPTASSSVATRAAAIRRVDQGTYNKGVLLRWNIDLRDPTVDRRLVEYCLRVPLENYFRNGTPRALIRTALKGRVPDTVLSEHLRGLQSPHWFSMLSEAREEAIRMFAEIEACENARRVLDIEKMRHLLTAWPDQTDDIAPDVYRYGLLRGLSAGQFIRLHTGC
jgi:asparagine synthase (glutamine-hydrolysing)